MTAKITITIAPTLLLIAAGPLNAFLIDDFEVDLGDLSPVYSPGSNPIPPETALNSTNPERVMAGVDLPGVNAAGASSFNPGGDYFVEIKNFYEPFPATAVSTLGDRVTWSSIPSGPFQSGIGQTVSVYFDDPTAELTGGGAAYLDGDAFFFQSSLLDDTNSFAIDGGGFGVRYNTDRWEVVADGDAKGFSGADAGASVISISAAGWYTMSTVWILDGANNIDQLNAVIDEAGNLVLLEVFEDVADADDVGGLGLASIGNGDLGGGALLGLSGFGALGIDNAGTFDLLTSPELVPEPSTYGLFLSMGAACLALVRRRRE